VGIGCGQLNIHVWSFFNKGENMSQHVTPGGLKSRREGAIERLEKHLAHHQSNHSKDKEPMDENKFKSHDGIQREELKHLQKLMA
jgi:hypothetical protein